MLHIEQIIPAFIGGSLVWFVLVGLKELYKETSDAFNKQSHA